MSTPDVTAPRSTWFLRGVGAAFSLPGLILISSFIGFAALAKDAGVTVTQAAFMTATVWALPSMVVLVGAVTSGAALPAAMLAVTLSAIRLMPMVMVLVPEMRTRTTRQYVLYLLAHFVAVTSWVLAMERLKRVPPSMRTTYYAGLGAMLVMTNVIVVTVVYAVADALPSAVSAALLMLTPMYFLTSLWGSARERVGHVAMVLGLVLGPFFHILLPRIDLLAAGLIGGTAAYGWHLWRRKARAA
ncbi:MULTISPECIES: AzlC family ABC transporter permease [unclassified Mesorhizobium]|uniref:AzlC family ABC transporter permease n=1 Tax=unclassified Mesorhizobium TaxID=325217 RepID=UPI001CCB6845|nr:MULTISPECIES: AzlC family ABC transporter permease [unclassified Mesorhizobium]MBZ9738603.1 AzlC family ABC transporter permease [Mesorhizobium sp. CO1-1-4]MBZ9800653.1 AzlC family ABC transporter permease [Mesorhizobium sp. ES1-6]